MNAHKAPRRSTSNRPLHKNAGTDGPEDAWEADSRVKTILAQLKIKDVSQKIAQLFWRTKEAGWVSASLNSTARPLIAR